MAAIIIGGGKIGYYLLKTLLERKVEAVMIERDSTVCEKIANDLDVTVICGDGTDIRVLSDAGIAKAEIVAAVTGKDEENLVICEIAKTNFSVSKTFARVNNPKNIAMFKALGIDRSICSTEVIANLIESELDRDDYHVVSTFERGALILVEAYITDKSPWNNKAVRNLVLPDECVITSIFRDEKIIFPRGDSEIHSGDKVLLITNQPVLASLRKHVHHGGIRS